MEKQQIFEFGRFRLDTKERALSADGSKVPLTPKVFDLLILFLQNPGHLLEKDWLLRTLWPETYVEEANLSVNISTLRRALETAGGEHNIETIPKRGYRFTGQVRVLAEPQEEVSGPSPAASNTSAARRLNWQIALLAGLCLVGLGLVMRRWFDPPIRSLHEVRSMAVLPFRPLGASRDAASGNEEALLGMGMADAIIRELSSIQRIRVRPTASVQKYSSGVEPRSAGRELGVDVVMDGRIQRIGQIVRVSVQLLRVDDGTAMWADRFDDYYTNIFQLQDSISEKVANALKMKLSETDHIKMTARGTSNLEAYELYLQGDNCEMNRTPDSPLTGCSEDYKAAVAKDPNYALAYAGIARVCMELAATDAKPELKNNCGEAARKAILLDDSLPEGHLAWGNVLFRADWDWLEAQREFNRGLTLDSYSPMAHWYMGLLVMAMGQAEHAVDEMKKALLLDPSSTNVRAGLIWAYNCGGRYEEAIRESKKMIAANPTLLAAHRELGRAYLEAGSYRAALAEFDTAARLDVRQSRSAGQDYLAALAEYRLTGKASPAPTAPDSSYEIAVLDANLGKFDDAFRALERAASLKLQSAIWMYVDPELAPIRQDPRFNTLLRQVHLLN